MTAHVGDLILHRRWLIIVLAIVFIVTLELAEHQATAPAIFRPDFWAEILVFGIGFPLMGATILARLTAGRAKPPRCASRPAAPQVLIAENSLLPGAGVQTLLNRQAGLNVAGVTPRNEVALIGEIAALRPGVVVIDEASQRIDLNYFLALAYKRFPELKIILTSANDDYVTIYDKRRILLTQVADFVEIIHH